MSGAWVTPPGRAGPPPAGFELFPRDVRSFRVAIVRPV
ncbi:hypothetical protein A33M_4314 [Rhodovulum sp. PH10]|nr:hypothetical protein A33M_4314 [Rhodovulum sp. PH10]